MSKQGTIDRQEVRGQCEQSRRALRNAFRPYIRGYRDLLARLRSEGFRVRRTSLMAPVQLEGHLPSGERFYFRCRHTACSLAIAPKGGDPVRQPSWSEEVSRWAWPNAGSLEAEETEAVLYELLADYRARAPAGAASAPQERGHA